MLLKGDTFQIQMPKGIATAVVLYSRMLYPNLSEIMAYCQNAIIKCRKEDNKITFDYYITDCAILPEYDTLLQSYGDYQIRLTNDELYATTTTLAKAKQIVADSSENLTIWLNNRKLSFDNLSTKWQIIYQTTKN